MDQLEQARGIINEVDKEMARLFVRRMEAVAMVAEYKKAHGLCEHRIFCSTPVRKSCFDSSV